MTQSIGRSPIAAALLLFAGYSISCSMRQGMNDTCEWPSEPATVLNLRNPVDERHLVDDVGVAEELGIRYHDARLARGTAAPDKPRTRDDCDTALFNEITATHAVTVGDVREARRRLTRGRWDPKVYVPLGVLYIAVALAMARRIRDRFSWPDERAALVIATLLASAAISAP